MNTTSQPTMTADEWFASQQQTSAPQPTMTADEWFASQEETQPSTQADIEITADDPGVLDYVKDIPIALSAGTNKAVNEFMDLSWGVGNFAKEAWDKGIGNAEFREPTKEEQANMWRLPVVQEAETTPGKLLQGVTQFITGYAATGTAMKAAKVLQGVARTTQLAKPMVQGAIADFSAFDAHDERLANLVEEYPALRLIISPYLAADDNDSMMEGRLKNALEGLGLGVLTDGLLQGLKAWKGTRKAKTTDEVIAAIDDVKPKDAPDAASTSPDTQPVKTENTPQKGVKAPDSDPVEARKESDTTNAPESAQKPPENAPYKEAVLDVDEMKAIVDKAANADEAFVEIHNNINLKRMIFETPQGSHVLKDMADALADMTLKAAGPESHAKVFADATAEMKHFGSNVEGVLAECVDNPKLAASLNRQILANRNMLHLMTTEMSRLAAKIGMNTHSLVDQAQFAMLTKNIQELHLQTADTKTEIARALSTMKMDVTDDTARAMLGEGFMDKWFTAAHMDNDAAMAWLSKEGWTPKQIRQLAADIQIHEGSPASIGKRVKQEQPGNWWNVAAEFRIGNMLSSPLTWGANFGGNLLKAYAMPAEQLIGGYINRNPEAIQAAKQTFYGLHMFLGDSFKAAWKATKTAKNILDVDSGIIETPSHQATYENAKRLFLRNSTDNRSLNPIQENIAQMIGFLGPIARFPSHIMVGTDELFKQIIFRADMRASLYNEATLKMGMKDTKQIASFIEEGLQKSFDENGAVIKMLPDAEGKLIKNERVAPSLLEAQRGTFTQALGNDTFMGGVQAFAFKHPSFRVIALPFIKTPTNLMRDFGAHTFLAPLSENYKKAIATGGEEAARARGQVAMGTLTMSMFGTLALGGFITGSPPINPKLRKAQEATGWEPYSIYIGGKYYSYRRFDPVGMFLGITADIMSGFSQVDSLSEIETEEILLKATAASINNLTSKTYMQGISEVLNVIQNPERYGTSYTGRLASTFVPASGLMRFTRKTLTDPYMREMESVADYVLNTLPIGSNFLKPRNNWVTGQPVEYRNFSGHDNNNPVLDELAHLGTSVVGAPMKKLEGVDLTAEQYSKLNELHGTVKIGGKTMSQALERLFNSSGYDLERNTRPDAPEGMPNPRADKVNKIIDRYRKASVRELKRGDADLQNSVLEAEVRLKASKRGLLHKSNEQEVLDRFINR